jgi:hypothetical protein
MTMPIRSRITTIRVALATAALLAMGVASRPAMAADPTKVVLLQPPDGGIQPQVVMDGEGTLHLVAFRGKPAGGDLFYSRLERGSDRFTTPVRVNSQPNSAIAMGTIRGAQIALGRGGRVHVAWNGSNEATPKNAFGSTPMLYTRSNPGRTEFEPQRNLMKVTSVLDGGGSLAADASGNVFVAWHARAEDSADGEAGRRLYVARSSDDGATFADESAATDRPTGACPCCGTKALADQHGTIYVLYRAATNKVGRDLYLLTSRDGGRRFKDQSLHPWRINACPMSSASLADTKTGVIAAWETAGQVYFARIDPVTGRPTEPIAPAGGPNRKHPSVAALPDGRILLAWAEGTSFHKGGALAWQVFDRDGHPTETKGRLEDGIPAFGLPAVAARPDGSFVIVH